MMTTTPLDPPTAARAYASLGWRVVPIGPGGKHPKIKEWQKAATHDLPTIDGWYSNQYAGHGVGIATGQETGLWVLDVDVAGGKTGDKTLDELQIANSQLPPTVTAITGSGGRHYYFAWSDDQPVFNLQNAGSRLGPGLDVRGDGGQVVAPPTIHGNGTPYAWETGRTPWDLDVSEAPAWLMELVTTPDTPQTITPVSPSTVDDGDSIAAWSRTKYNYSQLLEDDGWTPMHNVGDDQYWCRPGKQPRDGHSAVLHLPDGPLVVFTTEAAELQRHGKLTATGDAVSLSLFGYLAATRYDGDRQECARQLRQQRNTIEGRTSSTPKPAATIEQKNDETDHAEWDEPTPLRQPMLTQVVPFPLHTMPAWTIPAIEDTRDSKQVPLDMAGCVALGALATATVGKVFVKVWDGWEEPCNLWIAVAAEPTSGKSPVMRSLLTGPIDAEEHELHAEHIERLRRHTKELEAAERDGDWQAVQRLTELIGEPPALTMDDSTPEALISELERQKRGLAVVSDEGGPLLGLDRYKNGAVAAKLDPYLKGHSGDSIKQNRQSRGRTVIRREHVNVAMTVTPQPIVLQTIWSDKELGGRGFIARMLVSLPDSLVGWRDMINQPESDRAVMAEYAKTLRQLVRRTVTADGTWTAAFDTDAQQAFRQFRDGLEKARRPGGALRGTDGQVNQMKIESAAARIAAIIAVTERPATAPMHLTVTVDHFRAGVQMATYFMAHEGALFGRLDQNRGLSDAEQVLEALRDMATTGDVPPGVWTKLADLKRGKRAFQASNRRLLLILDELADHGWIKVDKAKVEGARQATNVVALSPYCVRESE